MIDRITAFIISCAEQKEPPLRAILTESDPEYNNADGFAPAIAIQVEVEGGEFIDAAHNLYKHNIRVQIFSFEATVQAVYDRLIGLMRTVKATTVTTESPDFSLYNIDFPTGVEVLQASADGVIAVYSFVFKITVRL